MNLLEQTPQEYKQEVEAIKKESVLMFKFCIGLILFTFFLGAYTTSLKIEQGILYGKIKQDSIAIQSYKNLTPKNQ